MNSKPKAKQYITYNHPKLVELLADLAMFTQKWQTPYIAEALGISKQALQYHINKKKKGGNK